jgi:hypothetical protein
MLFVLSFFVEVGCPEKNSGRTEAVLQKPEFLKDNKKQNRSFSRNLEPVVIQLINVTETVNKHNLDCIP